MKKKNAEIVKIVEKCLIKLGSYQKLADLLGVHRTTVNRWHIGSYKPNASDLMKMLLLINGEK